VSGLYVVYATFDAASAAAPPGSTSGGSSMRGRLAGALDVRTDEDERGPIRVEKRERRGEE